MNKNEVMQILAIFQTSYPNHYKNFDKAMMKITIEVWHKAFYDHDFETVTSACYQHILQSQFPPTIAELRKEVIKITNPEALRSGEEAWEGVIKAVRKFGYYRKDKALNSFDEATRRSVEAIGWEDICKSEKIGIERANFLKMFEALNKTEKEQALLPVGLYEQIKGIASKQEQERRAKNEQIKLQKL